MFKKEYGLVSVILLLALASCTMQYPQSQAATPQPTNPFTNPIPTGNEPMAQVEGFATGTSIALTMGAGGGSGSVNTPTPTAIGGTGGATAIPTNTPIGGGGVPSSTPLGGTGGATAIPPSPIPVTGRPATYTLQSGEHPYCIARRFNVDPTQLLQISGLSDGVIYPAGTLLHIPQSGSFPGDRSLRPHPTTYTVTSSNETFYSIACLFGDVDPARIAQANPGLSLGSVLPVGKPINIP